MPRIGFDWGLGSQGSDLGIRYGFGLIRILGIGNFGGGLEIVFRCGLGNLGFLEEFGFD